MSAKFNFLVAGSVALVPLIPLLACGGDDANKVDSGIVVHDSQGSGSGSGSGSNNVCLVMSNLGSPNIAQSAAFYTPGSGSDLTNQLDWEGLLPSTTEQDIVSVRIFGGCGSGSGSQCMGQPTPDWPTTFSAKSGIDLGSAVDAFVVIFAGVGSNGQAQAIYLSTGGTLNVTMASNGTGAQHVYAGSISNVNLVHLDTSTGQPAADNCATTITGITFTGSAQAGFTGKGIEYHSAPFLAHRYQ
jgi:hypothetical protein